MASRRGKAATSVGIDIERLLAVGTSVATARIRGRGRTVRHEAGRMNKLEAAYAAHLASEQVAGRVIRFRFEALKLRLADATFYAPDFLVLLSTGAIELHEVKGHWEDDARVKWKATAEQFFEFFFVAVTRVRSAWHFERYGE